MQKTGRYIIFKIAFWALLFLPVFFIADAGKEIYNSLELNKKGLKIEGEVMSVRERNETGEDGTTTYYIPTVRYFTEESGEIIRELEENSRPYSRNQKIELIYKPGFAKYARHNSFEILYMNHIGHIVLSLFLTLIFGGLIYFFGRKFLFN